MNFIKQIPLSQKILISICSCFLLYKLAFYSLILARHSVQDLLFVLLIGLLTATLLLGRYSQFKVKGISSSSPFLSKKKSLNNFSLPHKTDTQAPKKATYHNHRSDTDVNPINQKKIWNTSNFAYIINNDNQMPKTYIIPFIMGQKQSLSQVSIHESMELYKTARIMKNNGIKVNILRPYNENMERFNPFIDFKEIENISQKLNLPFQLFNFN